MVFVTDFVCKTEVRTVGKGTVQPLMILEKAVDRETVLCGYCQAGVKMIAARK